MQKQLEKYNAKRNFHKTSEPIGLVGKKTKKRRFVIQHHLATTDHFDFRLEMDGVLKSWAVPKGLSDNPKVKRLAVQVEDHPLSYRNFEGIIPEGEYGGGTVMLFDRGTFEECPSQDQSLKFILHGQRFKGKWVLVPFRDHNWLIIKEKDEYALKLHLDTFKTSVKSGLTIEQIKQEKKLKTRLSQNIIDDVTISNPDKIIFSKPLITKKDIAVYYHKVAKKMLPYLQKRVISTIRAPQGLKGDHFFKKHFSNERGMKKIYLKNQQANKEDYYYIDNITGIINEVQMNGFEFHIGSSLAHNYNKPNMMVFDLDPDETISIAKLRKGVCDLKSILDELNLVSFLKTSGGKGYHIVVPFTSFLTWRQFTSIAKNIALLMEQRWPDKYTSNMRKNQRQGKIYIDWVRNTKGASAVAPYSLRLRDKASVSLPIKWSDLKRIKPDEMTMEKALKYCQKKDPWQGFFNVNQ